MAMAERTIGGRDEIGRRVRFSGFDDFNFSLWLCGEQAQVRGSLELIRHGRCLKKGYFTVRR